jgi:hypothetical protein
MWGLLAMILRFVPYIGALDDHRLENIFKTVSDLVEDLAEQSPGGSAAQPKELSSPLTGEDFWQGSVLCSGVGAVG